MPTQESQERLVMCSCGQQVYYLPADILIEQSGRHVFCPRELCKKPIEAHDSDGAFVFQLFDYEDSRWVMLCEGSADYCCGYRAARLEYSAELPNEATRIVEKKDAAKMNVAYPDRSWAKHL